MTSLSETGGAGEGGGAEGASRGVRLGRRQRRRRDARDPRPGQTDPREEASAGPGVQGEGRPRAPHAQDRHQGEEPGRRLHVSDNKWSIRVSGHLGSDIFTCIDIYLIFQ